MKTLTTTLLFLIIAFTGLWGCDEPIEEWPENRPGVDTGVGVVEHGVRVRTQFEITDLDQLPEDIDLSQLMINLGAIFLEPIRDGDRGIAFANRTPVTLDFSFIGGDFVLPGPVLDLPWGGEFAVSAQIEPINTANGASIVTTGTWTKQHIIANIADNESFPITHNNFLHLLDPIEIAIPIEFEFLSSSVVKIQLAEVSLTDDGECELTFSIRLADWIRESVVPLLESEVGSGPYSIDAPNVIPILDVVDIVNTNVYDIENLIGDTNVSTCSQIGTNL